MKTEVIMKRQLFGCDIRQKSKSEYLSANDLVNAGNYYRASNKLSVFNLSMFLKNADTLEFISAIEEKTGFKAVIRAENRGRNGCTWVHPLLFIDIALAIHPTLKLETYSWLLDYLLKYRNESGVSYKKMCGSVALLLKDKRKYQATIIDIATKIKLSLGVDDWNSATEEQLMKRDKIQNNISLLTSVLKRIDTVVDLAIKEVLNG